MPHPNSVAHFKTAGAAARSITPADAAAFRPFGPKTKFSEECSEALGTVRARRRGTKLQVNIFMV